MKIAITVGHSILKNGNITSADGTKFGGVNEYKYNKELAPFIVKYLKEIGHTVDLIICPEKQFTLSTQEKSYKLNIVNDGTYDLVVELHLNAASGNTPRGTEVLYKSYAGKVYAERVQAKLSTLFTNRGIKYRDNLYMLTKTDPTAIMVETFFCTNSADYHIGLDTDRLGRLIAEGIAGKDIADTPATTITPKSSTKDIKWLQEKLNKTNTNYTIPVTGIFNYKTSLAVKIYADSKGWKKYETATGYSVGINTIKALEKY
jgi:N-acetylmuramoyl-L-alanine amidase